MNMQHFANQFAWVTLSLLVSTLTYGQNTVDLVGLAQQNSYTLENRSLTVLADGTKPGVRLEEKQNSTEGVAWLPALSFREGTIELDIRGKDVLQRSFVGIAFHGSGERNYDAIYFRPFNFRATDPVRHSHAVQYIALPTYDWPVLRKDFPDQYEQPIEPAPDPNAWFHARIVVDKETVSVFVNENAKPSLVVKKLNDRRDGKIGLWVGAGSGGDFANLKITPRTP
ncbi:hypothetical protein [Larkinella humicola]|uniref:3-keto-disaccharide hydrolase domain-containing protein n=1 Tax=Larkinella humicola TaxID=2607654 RepID=A0A5N1JKL2_9BACT|nr:hypothetical protein [Larkinella humicola]KAA9357000.1 hypothetical protein F0P93_04490 [Larkinella humicola]